MPGTIMEGCQCTRAIEVDVVISIQTDKQNKLQKIILKESKRLDFVTLQNFLETEMLGQAVIDKDRCIRLQVTSTAYEKLKGIAWVKASILDSQKKSFFVRVEQEQIQHAMHHLLRSSAKEGLQLAAKQCTINVLDPSCCLIS